MKTFGVLLLIAGIASFLWSAPKLDTVHSGLGQLAVAFGGQSAQDSVNMYQTAYYGGIAACVAGLASLIIGCLQRRG